MRGLARCATIAFLLACSAPTPAARLDAAEILRRAEQVRSPELDYAVELRLDVTSETASWKKRHAAYTMIAHGKEHSLVLMREPRQFYPGTLLISKGLFWLLLPRSSKPLQLSPRAVLNGDIANGDLARGNLIAQYTPQLDGVEPVRGEACYRLELSRKVNLGLYRRIRCWITKRGFRPRKFEYYGHTDALLKTAYYEDYRNTEIGLRSMRIDVENHTRPGERSVLTFSSLRRIDSGRIAFTREAMADFRDAARAVSERQASPASAEQLLAELAPEPR